ncbi:hypothetical protein [Ottowia testudinis]|uniref:Uncharacterized protein n=1 Tax=Ottowia testudinis TaxID=2816950 RepID=A0A975H4G0_9BURK|nr:hypothetical protein [Ottowia testudinis]QTD46848.1 hypothetical protein J1M35_08240 [Ottowia testudinis]
MEDTLKTLLAADLADRWIDAILNEQADLLLHADSGDTLGPHDMAQNLAQFRASLIEALHDQPIPGVMDDGEGEDGEEA